MQSAVSATAVSWAVSWPVSWDFYWELAAVKLQDRGPAQPDAACSCV